MHVSKTSVIYRKDTGLRRVDPDWVSNGVEVAASDVNLSVVATAPELSSPCQGDTGNYAYKKPSPQAAV